ncbi:MAG: penicillin-binding transpeptidase domain-containing protein, partial [Myxococcaceae bacterium]
RELVDSKAVPQLSMSPTKLNALKVSAPERYLLSRVDGQKTVAANEGLWRNPILFEDAKASEPVKVMSAERAHVLTTMMEQTVTEGTARRIFHERGFKVTNAVGKTGSLADKKPFRDYTWFVGFAPKDDPKVAVAAVIVNDMKWRIRATWLAREAMRLYLEEQSKVAAASK